MEQKLEQQNCYNISIHFSAEMGPTVAPLPIALRPFKSSDQAFRDNLGSVVIPCSSEDRREFSDGGERLLNGMMLMLMLMQIMDLKMVRNSEINS